MQMEGSKRTQEPAADKENKAMLSDMNRKRMKTHQSGPALLIKTPRSQKPGTPLLNSPCAASASPVTPTQPDSFHERIDASPLHSPIIQGPPSPLNPTRTCYESAVLQKNHGPTRKVFLRLPSEPASDNTTYSLFTASDQGTPTSGRHHYSPTSGSAPRHIFSSPGAVSDPHPTNHCVMLSSPVLDPPSDVTESLTPTAKRMASVEPNLEQEEILMGETPTKLLKKSLQNKVNHEMNQNSSHMAVTDPTDKPQAYTPEQIFKKLRLRRILKENHASSTLACCFNFNLTTDADGQGMDTSNMVATIGGCTANVYDNENCVEHLDIVSHFDGPMPFRCVCWIKCEQDAMLALGDEGGFVRILSLARSEEILVFPAHTGCITHILPHPTLDSFLLTSSPDDGSVRIWDWSSEQCVCKVDIPYANQLAFHPDGNTFVVGTTVGKVIECTLLPSWKEQEGPQIETKTLKLCTNGAEIDCLRYVQDRLIIKSVSGKILIWSTVDNNIMHTITVKGAANACSFDVSGDSNYLCVGNAHGSIFIYDLLTAKCITELRHKRVTKPIHGCIFSKNMKQMAHIDGHPHETFVHSKQPELVDEGYSSMPSLKNDDSLKPSLLKSVMVQSQFSLDAEKDIAKESSFTQFENNMESTDELYETDFDNTQLDSCKTASTVVPQQVWMETFPKSSICSRPTPSKDETDFQSQGLTKWKGLYNIVEEIEKEIPDRTISTPCESPQLRASATLKQRWAKLKEIPLPPLIERLISTDKKEGGKLQQVSSEKPMKRSSSAGMAFLKSPPLLKRMLAKDKTVDVKGKQADKAKTQGIIYVSDEAPDFTSEKVIQAGEAAQKLFESKYVELKKQLGTGGHSTVCLAKRVSDGQLVVCKYMKHTSVWHWYSSTPNGHKIPLEIHLMKKLSVLGHPSIIHYIEHFEMAGKYIIVMEYMGENWIDLYDYIEMYGPVREDHSKEIFQSVVETILYMHHLGYSHNDIKDENILINTKTRAIKLIDFGSTTPLQPGKRCSLFYGTKKFAAPEAVSGESYFPEAQESWSLGTLLYVLLFKMDPFKDDNEIVNLDISRRISRLRTNPPGIQISEEAVNALVCLMEKDFTKRIPVTEILSLPFFK